MSVAGEDQHFTNYATHAGNTAYVLVDIMITGVPFRLLHGWVAMLFAIVYFAFSIIYWAISDNIIYDALDYGDNLGGALGYVGIAMVAMAVIQLLLFCLYWLRVLLAGCCCGCCGGGHDDGDYVQDETEMAFQSGETNKYMTSIEIK